MVIISYNYNKVYTYIKYINNWYKKDNVYTIISGNNRFYT